MSYAMARSEGQVTDCSSNLFRAKICSERTDPTSADHATLTALIELKLKKMPKTVDFTLLAAPPLTHDKICLLS